MGPGTHRVPFSMHSGNRERVVDRFLQDCPPSTSSTYTAIFRGGDEIPVYDTDTEWHFRQECNFQYLFGVKEPGFYGVIQMISGATTTTNGATSNGAATRSPNHRAVLLIPELDPDHATWLGPIRSRDFFRQYYEVDAVYFLGSTDAKQLFDNRASLVTPTGTNLDSGAASWRCDAIPETLPSPKFDSTQCDQLWHSINECRVVKSAEEIEVVEFSCKVSAEAHVAVMKKVYADYQKEDPKTATAAIIHKEYLSEAEFRYQSYLRGCARTAYACICPAGERAAILHYGHAAEPNNEEVLSNNLKLHDMGAEYHCYAADVTCTFPVSGTFSEAQRKIYEAVWAATTTVEKSLKPGVRYGDMHVLAQKTLLRELTGWLFKGDADGMFASGVIGNFMPHGLGHMLGRVPLFAKFVDFDLGPAIL